MSVFSMIKRGRQAAKEHRAEQAKKEREEAQKPPYKHIPKHAAIDALSGGPAGWREGDRRRIVEQNKRRSAMTTSGVGMSGFTTPVHAGMPRVQTALSHVSYPIASASPVVQLPRAYSYSSMPPGWTSHAREMSYSPIDMVTTSLKGKEVERVIDSSRTSRSSSKMSTGRIPLPPSAQFGNGDATPSPVESSSGSTSSQDDLEMKPVARHSAPIPASPGSTRPDKATSDAERIHRLHPGRSRRISDPNQAVVPTRSPLAPRTSPLGPEIPPVPALPPLQFGTAITTPEVFSSAASSSASSVTMVPVASSTSLAAKAAPAVATPMVLTTEEAGLPPQAEFDTVEYPDEEEAVPVKTPVETPSVAPIVLGVPAGIDGASPTKNKKKRISKVARFTELEPIKSNTTTTTTVTVEPTEQEETKKRPTSTSTALPTSFDETALPAANEIVLPSVSKAGKLSKTPAAAGGKLVKKNRWSLRSSKSTAVAG
ncbi:hypothetical protein C8A03DRAFT_35150 [Achaetomium macrosporum]|uniref:Uncharacterized protein n=1 Tax=Achaetomium macrosporum TaxID=79813 RepID=A0AAN7HE81_9PEZI|nr:hypothetical protein C8A03DRAFT_35150 [Achaetomium macrosporum]